MPTDQKLPDTPGVYFFRSKNKILYIGKATSLRNRVRSYFGKDILEKRGPLIEKMMQEKLEIKFQQTDSVLEALLLEAELIKKHLPPYNTKGKDQKSWNYVVITDEDFPRVLITRGREITPLAPLNLSGEPKEKFGPFTSSSELREALKIVRKIFPFRDKCVPNTKPCFNYQLGLCPGVCVGAVSKQEYARTINHIKLFFQGKKGALVKKMEKEMKLLAKERKFEEAAKVKDQLFALQHINDIALIKNKFNITDAPPTGGRIEAYDVAHISGTSMVGVMTVVEDKEPKKTDYRMFKIRGQRGPDDTKALKEVLERRLRHPEWRFPSLIVVDGGVAQLNVAEQVLANLKLKIPVVAVTKDNRHKAKEIQSTRDELRETIAKYKREILLANSESHRFALNFHKKRRSKAFLPLSTPLD